MKECKSGSFFISELFQQRVVIQKLFFLVLFDSNLKQKKKQPKQQKNHLEAYYYCYYNLNFAYYSIPLIFPS